MSSNSVLKAAAAAVSKVNATPRSGLGSTQNISSRWSMATGTEKRAALNTETTFSLGTNRAGLRLVTTVAGSSPPPPRSHRNTNNNSACRAVSTNSDVVLVTTTQASSLSSTTSDATTTTTPRRPPLTSGGAPSIVTPETTLVDSLLQRTFELLDPNASNVIAYSGGVDSSLTALLVHRTFSSASHPSPGGGSVKAVLGLSPAVPTDQINLARSVADYIGIPYYEIPTSEGIDPTYIRNDGEACLACKTNLYSTLNAVAAHATSTTSSSMRNIDGTADNNSGGSTSHQLVLLYNGTNADDVQDPTRLGLRAASTYHVHSPLRHTTKADVRMAAKHLGLPNWNYAASPCLRSRLALGVEATKTHLEKIARAESWVRMTLKLDPTVNMRVRMLAGNRAMIELDEEILEERDGERILVKEGLESVLRGQLGFDSFGVRPFRSGSVAGEGRRRNRADEVKMVEDEEESGGVQDESSVAFG